MIQFILEWLGIKSPKPLEFTTVKMTPRLKKMLLDEGWIPIWEMYYHHEGHYVVAILSIDDGYYHTSVSATTNGIRVWPTSFEVESACLATKMPDYTTQVGTDVVMHAWSMMKHKGIHNWVKGEPDAKIFDANNVEIQHVLWCDANSGLLCRYNLLVNGFETDKDGDLVEVIETRPAPLKIYKCGPS